MLRPFVRPVVLACITLAAAVSVPLGAQSSVLVPAGSTWRYLDDGSNQGTAWRAAAYNDGAWGTGRAQLGYGDGDEATVVGYGGNASAKHVTTYFRRTFSVTNPGDFASLSLRLLRDDGAVVYLNGSEVLRTNMPGGTIGYTTLASATVLGADESAFITATLSSSLLVAGSNVLAVEVHQSEPDSSDLSFDLELLGGSSVALTRGPYLQLGTPTSMVVRWRTSAPVVGRVQFGPSPGVIAGSAQETSARTEHEVHLTGLTPDTLYYYSVGTPTTTMAGGTSFQFKTSPPAGTRRPTRVWVTGDSGTADPNARAVRDAYTAFTGSRPTDLWLMLGDNAYDDGLDHEYQAAVFDMYPAMLRKTVLWPTLGNHDGYGADSATNTGPYYDIFTLPKQGEAGGLASGTEAYYSFDYANIHFVCLESFETNRLTEGPMLTWLQRDLAANTQPWVIVFFHHPPYSKGSHNSDIEIELVQMRQNALPILENFGVDLVLAGHSHSYERSFLIDGHYGDSTTFSAAMKKDGGSGRPDASGAYQKSTYGMAPREGAVYVVAGTSGKISGGTLDHPAMFTSQSVLGSVVLDVDGSRLDVTFLDSNGARRDYFSIVKGEGQPAPPSTGAFGGTPAAIPGAFEAENFDEGGQGIAYYDTKPGNSGGAYRSTDVDIEPTADTGGGYNVGWTKAGEWLKYTVNVAATGTYALETRVASLGAGGRFHVEVDGVDRTGPIVVPDTGSWQKWQTVTTTGIPLAAGQRIIRVFFARAGSGGGVGNFNWFRLEGGASSPPPPPPPPPPPSPAYGGTPVALPGIVQGENFDEGGQGVAYYDLSAGNSGGVYRNTDVDVGANSDPSSNGYHLGWARVGEWVTYSVNVTESRNYALDARVANLGSGSSFRIEVDGVDRTGPILVPNTGGWDVWQTLSVTGIPLTQGLRVIRVVMITRNAENSSVGNFGYFHFR
ncbi:hypothetical protein BH24ACI5_BH24ACI5_08860 [soil metagenome]